MQNQTESLKEQKHENLSADSARSACLRRSVQKAHDCDRRTRSSSGRKTFKRGMSALLRRMKVWAFTEIDERALEELKEKHRNTMNRLF
jgi:hypothetical protein